MQRVASKDELRPDLVGDGYDVEPLLTAAQVAEILSLPLKSVYELPIRKVRLGKNRIRYRPTVIREFIESREVMV